MPKYQVYGKVVGRRYLGTIEVTNKEEAEKKGWEAKSNHCDNCLTNSCSYCIFPEIDDILVEEETS